MSEEPEVIAMVPPLEERLPVDELRSHLRRLNRELAKANDELLERQHAIDRLRARIRTAASRLRAHEADREGKARGGAYVSKAKSVAK